MASFKQTREIYRRITYHRRQLASALNRAHNLKIIQYDDYMSESPCSTLTEVHDRIDKTTEKALAEALRLEIEKDVPW